MKRFIVVLFLLLYLEGSSQSCFHAGFTTDFYPGKNAFAGIGAKLGYQFNSDDYSWFLRVTSTGVFGHGKGAKLFIPYSTYAGSTLNDTNVYLSYSSKRFGLAVSFYHFLKGGDLADHGWFVGGGFGFSVLDITSDNNPWGFYSPHSISSTYFMGDLHAGGGFYYSFDWLGLYAQLDLHCSLNGVAADEMKSREIPMRNIFPGILIGLAVPLPAWNGGFGVIKL